MRKVKSFLDGITESEAFTILKILTEDDKEIAKRAEQVAREVLSKVDIEEVAEEVFSDLDNIQVEDLWDSSGRTRGGYVEPCERAGEMFEETLKPHLEKLKRYQKLLLHNEAKSFCKGILKGLYKFKEESTTEYAEYVEDEPEEYSKTILEEWIKSCKNQNHKKEMKKFFEQMEWK